MNKKGMTEMIETFENFKDTDVELQVDHVYPKSKGGDDNFKNLVTACKECNTGKREHILKTMRR